MSGLPGARPREAWADLLKGALIVLVVFWHVVLKTYLQVDWRLGAPIPGGWGMVANAVWPWLMPLFLFLSGYFAATALRRRWSRVVRPRILRFLWLFVLWTLIHIAALWAFPDFPTFVPRTLGELVEAMSISPMDTWYLLALAAYFAIAKLTVRIPWLTIAAAGVLSIAVGAGSIEIVSNRGSLLSNLVFFLLGAHLAPRLRRWIGRVPVWLAAVSAGAYAGAFALVGAGGAESVPGVWPALSSLGIVAALCAAPWLVRIHVIARGLTLLGRRTLPIYLLHMPLLALADAALVPVVSDSGGAVQLITAVTLPPLLTGLLVRACLAIARVTERDRFGWLWDLPERGERQAWRAPWRSVLVVALFVAATVALVRASTVAGCGPDIPRVPAAQQGVVSIGAAGDVLMHDVSHGVPDDGGAAHFAAVEEWFTQDLVTANLEQVVSDDTGFVKCADSSACLAFRSAPSTAAALAGFDIVNVANNHTHDYGDEGYAATRAHLLEKGVRSVGDRDEVACTRVGDTVVAMIGFAPYNGMNRVTDLRHVQKVVSAASASADIVVVHSHMGAEGPDASVVRPGRERMFGEERGDVVSFAHTAVDAGADLVIGHGPHTLRGMEFRDGRLIAYSLGNFGGGGVFGAEPETRHGVYLEVTLGREGAFVDGRLRSVTFDHEEGRPRPDPDQAAARLVAEFTKRDLGDAGARVDADGSVSPP